MTVFRAGNKTTPDLYELRFATPTGNVPALTVEADGIGTLTLPAGVSVATLSFTDGDTLKRFTITDANVTTGSLINVSVRRANIADVDDPGWIYIPNVVTIANGSFDVLVAAYAGDAPAAPGEWPNESATLVYVVQ